MGPSNKNVRFLPLLPEAVRLCNGEFRRPTAEESEDYEPPRDSDADQESSISSASSLRDSELPESLRTLETEENEPQSSCSDEDAMSQDEDVMDCDSDIDDDDEDDEEESEEMEESQRDLLIFTIRDPNMFVKLRPACNLKENNKNYSIMQPKDSESALKFFNQEGLIDVDDRWAVSIAKALIAKLFKVRQGTGEDLDAIVADDDGDLGTVLSETDDCIVVTPRATEDVVEKLADYDYCADDISFIYSRDEEPLKAHHELVSQWLDWLKEKKVYNDKESTAFLKKLFAEPKFENVSHPKTVAAARFLPRLFNSLTSS